MTDSNSYDLHASHRTVDAEIQRLAAQARLGWDKEARTLTWFGLSDGMAVLELGSGPGFITEQLRALVPASPLTCLEINPTLLAQAKGYLHDQAIQNVQFVEGSVMGSQLAADQFDLAYARLLFQHLPDPLGAAREIWRVLKPGGKLVIYDIDDGLFGILQPPMPELSAILQAFSQAQAARGGNRQIGRRLWRMLSAAGFCKLDLEVVATHSDEIGIQPFMEQLDPDRLESLVTLGLLSAPDLAAFRAAHARTLQAAEPYVLWLSVMVCAEKPR